MAGPTDLYDLARELLDAAEEAVAGAPGGPIARAFVSPGLPALDCCPMISVHAGGASEGDTLPLQPPLQPGRRPGGGTTGAVHLVTLTVTVVRCVPVPTSGGQTVRLPSAADLEAVSRLTLGDLWAIWVHLRRRYQAGTLFASPSGRREFFFDPAIPLPTSGGCAGWEVQVRVALWGYEE